MNLFVIGSVIQNEVTAILGGKVATDGDLNSLWRTNDMMCVCVQCFGTYSVQVLTYV